MIGTEESGKDHQPLEICLEEEGIEDREKERGGAGSNGGDCGMGRVVKCLKKG